MLLPIDNCDCFTHNLVQYFGDSGESVHVVRNNAVGLAGITVLEAARVVISSGPCTSAETGISLPIIREFVGKLPILDVCPGHQAIGQDCGGRIGHVERKRVQFHAESILTGHGHATEKFTPPARRSAHHFPCLA